MTRTKRAALAAASIVAAAGGAFAVASPAQAAASVTLTCEMTYHYFDCTATPSGGLGTIRWYVGGQLDSAFNDNVYWNRQCLPPAQITVQVVYTDPTGSVATKTKTPSCGYYTP
jgi:hypothetical protein